MPKSKTFSPATTYQYGFSMPEKTVFETPPGLNETVVKAISAHKNEPEWMTEFRLRSLKIFESKPVPTWGGELSKIDFQSYRYYLSPSDKKTASWDEVPAEVKETYDRLGIPEAERKFLAGVGAQYDSEVLYHNIREDLTKQGVIFVSMDTALRDHPELVKPYFGTIIPPSDNKFAALNSATWSGGSFIYVPKGVKVELPLQAYFRINAENIGQFERTLIIVEEGGFVHYVEGCSAPIYAKDSLHAAVVEIIVKPGARCRYTTIQNWSKNVYNLVTKRASVFENGTMEWVDFNSGCLTADTRVFTNPKGAITITSVKPGDWVYGFDLNKLAVVKKRVKAIVNTGIKEVYKLITDNFREIKATNNHPFLTLKRIAKHSSLTFQWKPLGELTIGDYVAIHRGLPDEGQPYNFDYKPSVNKPKIVPNIPETSSPELLWLFGLYIGDGYIEKSPSGQPRRIYFAVPPQDRARKRLEQTLKNIFGLTGRKKGICLTVNSTILAGFFQHIGFIGTAHQKRIPHWISGLPLGHRLAFIEGYLDADGYVRKVVGRQLGQIIFASVNQPLLEDYKMLMIGCGLKPMKLTSHRYKRQLPLGKEKKFYHTYFLGLPGSDLPIIRGRHSPDTPHIEFVKIRDIKRQGREPVYDMEIEGVHNFLANGLLVHNSRLTMKYPSCYLRGRKARGDILSVALAGPGQHQDAGGKIFCLAPETSGTITSKSVSFGGGRTSYRGLVRAREGATNAKIHVVCDALLLDPESRSDTYPTVQVEEETAEVGHEATVARIGDEQLLYLRSRGLSEAEARTLIVNGFFEQLTKELPMEYAIEMNRLIQLEMEGSVG